MLHSIDLISFLFKLSTATTTVITVIACHSSAIRRHRRVAETFASWFTIATTIPVTVILRGR